VKTWMAAQQHDSDIGENEVREALIQFEALWDELFPAEQARIVQLLIKRVDVDVDGISIRLRTEGIGSVVSELRQPPELSRAA
jgi:site-specific DNA recombinase